MLFLKWFFPRKIDKKAKYRPISWEASQFLYYVWRKINDTKKYGHTSIMTFIQYGCYEPIRGEVEYFLTSRGYAISYFENSDNVLEIIISW